MLDQVTGGSGVRLSVRTRGPVDAPPVVHYTALMQEFHSELAAQSRQTGEHYLLTADVSANPATAANIQLGTVAKSLDWFNVMTFDFHGSWEANGPTDFASNTFFDRRDPQPANNSFSATKSVAYYESQGVPASKIGLAAPYYAHVWSGVSAGPRGDGLFQAATGAPANSTPNYNAVVTAAGTQYFDFRAGEPYKYDPTSQTFSTYENPTSMAIKGAYIWAAGLRGTFVWSLDGDTSNGSLTAAIGRALGH